MYNIVVVDDEKIVRDGMTSYFSDGENGFTVIKSFGNGEEAYDYLKENKNEVDVVLTDITMPKMSGLELVKKIYDEKMDIQTILLTGYKEFEYAQTAVKYDVYRYLLKPVRFNELDEVFNELREILDEKAKKLISNDLQDKINFSINQFLIELYSGYFDDEKIMTDRIKQLKIDEEILNKPCVIIDILRNVEKAFEDDKWKYDEERFDIAIFNAIRCRNIQYYSLKSDKEFLNIIAVAKFDVEEEEFFSDVKESFLNGINNLKQIFSIDIDLINLENYENIQNMLYSCYKDDEEKNTVIDEKINNSAISRAIKYVNENYKNNIYISDVAEYVGLNQVYFGRLFKIYTGENFTDYLINLRVEKAMSLLCEGNMKISEVSESVGYDNIKYFSRIFKRRTGKTPIDYKKERM